MSKKKRVSDGPVLFWHSDPVMPDETVLLSGADFSASTVVAGPQSKSAGPSSVSTR